MSATLALGAAGSVAGVMAVKEILNWVVPLKYQPQYRMQKERDDRLEEFQLRQQKDNQMHQEMMQDRNMQFQAGMERGKQTFQLELEANRMAFQEKQEMRRLQFQTQMEAQREKLQMTLANMNIRNSQEIAKFQAIAMRETQILVARENAQNMLQDHMVQAALKDFPLNISPLVLLKNRPHSLSSLLRFTVEEKDKNSIKESEAEDVCRDVLNYAANPEALNIFVAPVYVDSKIKNRQVLSDQIWDTTYQKLESFFTMHYNRRSERPVIFYPTAWNNKFNPGMHASETLHFFLKDMPCIVIEPRFDGLNFRLMISAWGLGYASTEHIRTELNFQINIDDILAQSVYERSKKALAVLSDLSKADIPETEKRPFFIQEAALEKNVKLYEALHLDERKDNGRMDEIDAFGIYNIFKVEPVQDLAQLSDLLSAQIGMTLASLSDIHHLKSTAVDPMLPELLKQYFPTLYTNKEVRELLFANYHQVLTQLLKDETILLTNKNDIKLLENFRSTQIDRIQNELEVIPIPKEESVEDQIRKIAKDLFDYTDQDFEYVWETCLDCMTIEHVHIFKNILPQITDSKKHKQLVKNLAKLSE